ncbi:hypothetical protein CTA1_8065 [Colletotrichum tanaceti]|uniref:Uncharacterized protein n=1 Tax=Colletotrichum tanaceti TaxID=1306861 RepID=A0A4U6X9Q2_9PEZI|nr:hypothetical protein CTA1_8065 [Colletotrichum tanaceti]
MRLEPPGFQIHLHQSRRPPHLGGWVQSRAATGRFVN